MPMPQSLFVTPENFLCHEDLEDELFEDGTLYDPENVYVPGDIADDHTFEESESQALATPGDPHCTERE